MDNKKMMAVLAVTVLAIPVAMSGCGKSSEEVPADDTVVSVDESNTVVNDTIEEDLSDMGIVVESDLDESMAGTYYVIAEDGIPYYAEDDTTSEVLGTLAYDTEVTSLGMSLKTNLFQIELEDGTKVWVENGDLDTFRGGYDEEVNLVKDEDTETKEEPEYTPQTNNSLPADSNSGSLTDAEFNAILEQYGFAPQDNTSGSSGGYDPSAPIPEFQMNYDPTGIPSHTVQ